MMRLSVEQAKNREEARRVARTVATSLLVKTAWAGADPNWGRILAAVGRAGSPSTPRGFSDPDRRSDVCRAPRCAVLTRKAHEHQSLAPRCEEFGSSWVEAAPRSYS